jgi:hypothetical protein
MKWEKDEIDKIIKLFNDGEDYVSIANSLKRTRQSIRIKLNKLGFFIKDKNRFFHEKYCKHCGGIFDSYKIEKRKFCSSSCSASFNNKIREKNNTPIGKKFKDKSKIKISFYLEKNKKCLNCDKIVTNKFCNSKCQHEYKRKILFQKIENQEIGISHKSYKKYLIEKFGGKCMECGWDKVNPITGKVPIELEHIDGNSENNSLENLKLLCPNCHSLTPTYKSLNRGNGRYNRMVRYKEGKSF